MALTDDEKNSLRIHREYVFRTEIDPVITNPVRWAEMSEAKQAEWLQYRRDWLDITDRESTEDILVWPTKPE